MSRGSGLRIYTDAAGLDKAVSPIENLLYIYLEAPSLSVRRSWVLVRRRPGLDGLVDALRFGLRFAPELLGFQATVVEALDAEELSLLVGLSPSDLGDIYVLFAGSEAALGGLGAVRGECPGRTSCYILRQYPSHHIDKII
ncbi:MAG: hypothetical protein ACP5I3_05155 [Thermoproteus sp.]